MKLEGPMKGYGIYLGKMYVGTLCPRCERRLLQEPLKRNDESQHQSGMRICTLCARKEREVQ